MAKCERIEQTPTPPPPVYRLELTQEEADVSFDTAHWVVGMGRRRLWDRISTALGGAGVSGKGTADIQEAHRDIWFK